MVVWEIGKVAANRCMESLPRDIATDGCCWIAQMSLQCKQTGFPTKPAQHGMIAALDNLR